MKILYWVGLILFGITLSSCEKDPIIVPTESLRNYSFYVAGHTYGKPGVDNVGVHPPFKDKFEFIRSDTLIDFGVFTGDIVLIGTEENWNEIDSDAALLDHPIYFAVGNHDMTDRGLYETRYGDTYKYFIQNNNLHIILDPNLDNWNISGDQLAFLKNTISDNYKNVDNIFVFFHQILWWEADNKYKNITLNSLQGRGDTTNFWTEIEPLFHDLPNNVYMFGGDVGANANGSEFMYDSYDNITFIASGMGGGVRDNIVIVDVMDDKSVEFRLIALNGNDVHSLGKLEDYKIP